MKEIISLEWRNFETDPPKNDQHIIFWWEGSDEPLMLVYDRCSPLFKLDGNCAVKWWMPTPKFLRTRPVPRTLEAENDRKMAYDAYIRTHPH